MCDLFLLSERPSAKGNEGRALYVNVTGQRVVFLLAFAKKTAKDATAVY